MVDSQLSMVCDEHMSLAMVDSDSVEKDLKDYGEAVM
jgi:hypothetical protein